MRDAGTGASVGPRAYGARPLNISSFGGYRDSPLAGSLLLGVGCAQHLAAGGRQLRQRYSRMRLRRLRRRFPVPDRNPEPIGEIPRASALPPAPIRPGLAAPAPF